MSQQESFEGIISHVRDDVDPSEAEMDELADATQELEARARAAAADRGVEIEVAQVGSTARGTFVSGDRDIDLFLQFPADMDADTLESHGIAIGQAILPDGRKDFAAHPYIKGTFNGFDIDVVPCFAVESAEDIRSAVDRSPFHNQWLDSRIDGLESDVRVAKRFLKGINAYGANVATSGFSGFLTELLVLEHGGFVPLLEAASQWSIPVGAFDPASHVIASDSDPGEPAALSDSSDFDAPLVVIDPTDPSRNVAAALSEENIGRFILNARQFLDAPDVGFFENHGPDLDPMDAIGVASGSGRTHVAITFDRPADMVDDTFVPQLRKTRESLVGVLDQRGFEVARSAEFANDGQGAILVAFTVADLPARERHMGPPVAYSHADEFLDAYEDDDSVVGPFIEGDRLVVEREREFRSAGEFLAFGDLFNEVSVGSALEAPFRDNRQVEEGRLALRNMAEAFPDQFAAFVSPNAISN